MKDSKIEWCDHTFNPWMGCTKVSPGCEHCYAENFADRFQLVKWGPGNPRKRTTLANWKQPLSWNSEYELDNLTSQSVGHGSLPRPRVFCASLADWLDHEVPIEWLADLLELIRTTPHLDWLLLTKRPQNWLGRISEVLAFAMFSPPHHAMLPWLGHWHPDHDSGGGVSGRPIPPANVWIGTTVEDQTRADQRIPELLKIPARVRFLSCEPLLKDVDISFALPWTAEVRATADGVKSPELKRALVSMLDRDDAKPMVNWVICGGESGPNARPMHPDWARALRDQCAAAGVPYLFKQWGEWAPGDAVLVRNGDEFDAVIDKHAAYKFFAPEREQIIHRVGKKAAGRLLDGVDHYAFPEGVT